MRHSQPWAALADSLAQGCLPLAFQAIVCTVWVWMFPIFLEQESFTALLAGANRVIYLALVAAAAALAF
jgi:hypothetical protein